MTPPYDSAPDTQQHINRVAHYLDKVRADLDSRARNHDQSKLGPEEKPLFDLLTPKLAELEYGTPEYKASLRELGSALEHHYETNSHHPEHFINGVDGMNLMDLIEMLVDWKAASERMRKPIPAAPGRPEAPEYDDNFENSIYLNQNRFKISPQLTSILVNTAAELGFTVHKNNA